MSSPSLPDSARELIRRHIDSVGRLDLLLVLYADPRERWTAGGMGSRMRAPARWARAQMRALEQAGILRCRDGAWSYDPADDRTAQAVQALATACRLDWPAVTREVMRTRPSGSQAFSDAFRIRRPRG